MSCFVMRAGGTLCDMSWDVMICMHEAHMPWPVRAWTPGIPFRFPGFSSSAWACLPNPSSFRSSRPAAPGGGTLIRAYPARARARVGAGAVRAPDCPRARGRTQGARLPSVPREFFAPGATGTKPPPDGVFFLRPDPATIAHMSTPISDIVQDMRTKCLYPPYTQGLFRPSASAAAPAGPCLPENR